MSQPFILAIDEGTTNVKAIAVGQTGEVLNKSSQPVDLAYPQAGWAEQDPDAIWTATQTVIQTCLTERKADQLAGIAISNQRESVLIWERSSGKALTPLISWQCRRSETICADIAQKPQAYLVKAYTGSVIDPLFPASKIRWLLDHLEDGQARAESGELCVGTIDSWLVWNLTGGQQFVTDASNASRYQLFNIYTQSWDPELLDLYGIPLWCLPKVMPSSGERGRTVGVQGMADGIPIMAQAGDSHAALYGQGGFHAGVVKATYGTGSSLMVRVDDVPKQDFGVSTTVAWDDGQPSLAMEGNITHTGAGIKFIARLLGIEDIDELSRLAWSVEGSGGLFFVPALSGLGAPHWEPHARGIITGLTDSSTPAHIARAAFESVVYQVADLFFAMQHAGGVTFKALSVDGGPSQNRALMQLQADVLQVPILRSETAEISALGAAYLAGRALGWWPQYSDLDAIPKPVEVIEPDPANTRIQDYYQQWKMAIERARYQPH